MKNWNLLRIKDVCKINPYTAFADSKIPFAPMSAIGTDGRLVIQEWKLNSDITKYSSARNGDVLFAKVTPCFENGKGCIVELSDPLLATTEVTVLRPFENIISAKYLSLITKSPDFLAYGKTNMKGANGLKRVTEKATAQYTFLVPNKSEQQAITQFLDDRTSVIDSKISALEEKEQSLAELRKSIIHEAVTKGLDPKVPMKASGVDWIGDIAAHWSVKRLKDIASIQKGEVFPSNPISSGPLYPYFNGGRKPSGWSNNFNADENNIAVSEGGASAGYVHALKTKYWAGSHCYKVTARKKMSREYLYYVLKGFEDQFIASQTGSAMPNLQKSKFLNLLVSYTYDEKEQQAIAAYLDERTSVIDQSIDTVKKEIEALQELRKSLIHEAVTGKLDVADFGYNY